MAAPNTQVGQGGRAPGRKRNTANSQSSDRNLYGTGLGDGHKAGVAPGNPLAGLTGGGLPALDPSMVANYYGQVQTLQSQLSQQLAALRTQRVGMRGDARVARSDVRAEGQAAMSEAIGGAMDRGILGSSGELEKRAAVRGDIAGGIADVNRGLYQAMAESRIQGTQAQLAYQQGVQGIEAQAIASRMQLAQQEEANRLQIQIAQMQAQASAAQTAATNRMANYELMSARQAAQAARQMANNPMAMYENNPQLYNWLVQNGFDRTENGDNQFVRSIRG